MYFNISHAEQAKEKQGDHDHERESTAFSTYFRENQVEQIVVFSGIRTRAHEIPTQARYRVSNSYPRTVPIDPARIPETTVDRWGLGDAT